MDVLEHFRQTKDYAKERLAKLSDTRELCFALIGSGVECPHYDFSNIAVLRRVPSPPSQIELAKALPRYVNAGVIARYMEVVSHELALACYGEVLDLPNVTLGALIISAIRTRSQVDILVPVVANVSWNIIRTVEAETCMTHMLEDVPSAHSLNLAPTILIEHLKWVDAHLESWIELQQEATFLLAVDAMTTHHHHANLRMSAAALWSGFEALFGINSELRFRLALMAAAYLEDRGPERLSLYQRIKKLYDYRSKAVHGGATTDEMLVKHIIEVRGLLSRLLCRMTEQRRLPSTDDFEALLLG